MSHIVTVETQIRDPAAIRAACGRLRIPEPVFGETQLFSAAETGWAVELPEWRYPIVCQVETGEIRFDDFGGRWGDRCQLDRFFQAYAAEKTRIEARKAGHTVAEQALADGSIKLTVNLAGSV